MKPAEMTLIDAVREKRERLGLSLRALSGLVGISFSTLARIERGDGMPDNNSQIRLLEWLGEDAAEAGLGFDHVALVHFRAAKNVASTTVELLLQAATALKADWSRRTNRSGVAKPASNHVPLALTKEELEQMAAQFRADLGLAPDQVLDPLKLDVEGVDVIRLTQSSCLSADIIRTLGGTACAEWSAMSVPLSEIDQEWAVLLNDRHNVERQRVTLLEEVWHILLEHKLTRIAKVGGTFGRTYEHPEEHDAYFLASATLLPREAVIDLLDDGASAATIAGRYGTSAELVEYRIKRLGRWREYSGKRVSLSQ